jgi:hypothetical protein
VVVVVVMMMMMMMMMILLLLLLTIIMMMMTTMTLMMMTMVQVTGFYDVPWGKYGTGYMVPYHNPSGYSGKLLRVNLHTEQLSYVRIHNVLTDFADYYSFRGQVS